MKKIYNELRKHNGKLLEFADYLVSIGLYSSDRTAREAIRHNVRAIPEVDKAYAEWRPGKFITRDLAKHSDKLQNVFKDIKRRNVKDELLSVVDVLEEALKELTLAIKSDNKQKLYEVKDLLQQALYGAQE